MTSPSGYCARISLEGGKLSLDPFHAAQSSNRNATQTRVIELFPPRNMPASSGSPSGYTTHVDGYVLVYSPFSQEDANQFAENKRLEWLRESGVTV